MVSELDMHFTFCIGAFERTEIRIKGKHRTVTCEFRTTDSSPYKGTTVPPSDCVSLSYNTHFWGEIMRRTEEATWIGGETSSRSQEVALIKVALPHLDKLKPSQT